MTDHVRDQHGTGGRLAELVEFARTNSPYYARLYADLPAGPLHIEDLPLVEHSEFWAVNGLVANGLLTAPQLDGIMIKTGGTTSAPKVSYYTRAEWRQMSRTFSTGLAAAGLRAGDRVANLFYAGELYSSFIFTLNILQEADIPTVQLPIAGNASPEFALGAIADCGATVLAGPPTNLCRLARHALDNGGPLTGPRLALFSGEGCYDDQRALLRTAFPNMTVSSIGYASVDAGILAAPVEGADLRVHQVFADSKLVEILDLDTGAPIEAPGVPGRVVATDLARRLMPVIRYPVGDLAEWVDVEAGQLRLLGRSEEGARVGPLTIYVDDMRTMLATIESARGVGAIQALLRHHDGKDQLVLRLAGQVEDHELVGKLLVDQIEQAHPRFTDAAARGVVHPIAVEWTELAKLTNPRTGKLVRLRDERSS